MASTTVPQRRTLDLGTDVVGMHLECRHRSRPSGLHFADAAVERYRDMGHAGGPARGLPFLRRDAGNAPMPRPSSSSLNCRSRPKLPIAASSVLRSRCASARRCRRCAVENVDAVLRRVRRPACLREFVDHAFDRPEGPARRHRPQLSRRGGVVRHLVEHCADAVIGHGVEEVRAVYGERVERALLVDRGDRKSGIPSACGPGADHVVIESAISLPSPSRPALTFW